MRRMGKKCKQKILHIFLAIFPQGKKGMMDDLFDFLFTTVTAFFMLLFISVMITSGIEKGHKQTYNNIDDAEAKKLLGEYLGSQVIVDNNKMTLLSLIQLWYSDQDKYETVLGQESKQILDSWSHSFVHPLTDNKRVKAFSVRAYPREPRRGDLPPILFDIKSNLFKSGFCEGVTCDFLGGTTLPLSESEKIYLVLLESVAAESTYE